MSPSLACILVTVFATAGLLLGEARKSLPLRAACKPVASLGFLGTAIAYGAADSTYGQAVLVALVLSLLGDVFLLSSAPRWFLGGLGAFLLGHVAFGAAFVLAGVDRSGVLVGAAAVLALLPFVARWLLPHVSERMKGPVIAYMIVISAMVALATGLYAATSEWVFLVAAVAFFISDLAVARERFVKKELSNKLWGLPLYYGAQLLFAWSVQL